MRREPRRRVRGRRSRRRGCSSRTARDFPTRLANASLTWTMRPWRSDDHHEMPDRVERVFELEPRPHDLVQQLQRLDGARQLAAELVGAVEQVELAAGFDPHAFEDDRAEGAAASAQRDRHRRRRLVGRRRDFGARVPQGGGGRRERVLRADRDAADDVAGIRRSLQHEVMGPPIVNPDRRAVRAEQALRAQAEDLEPGRQVHRGRDAGGEVVDQRRGGRAAARRGGAGGSVRAPSGMRRTPSKRPPRSFGCRAAARKPTTSRPTRSSPAARAAAARADGVPSRAARSGMSRPTSATKTGLRLARTPARAPPSPRDRGSTDRSAVRRGRSPTWRAATRCAGCARRAA